MTLQALGDPLAAGRQSMAAIEFATAALRAGDPAEAQRLLRQHLLRVPRDPAALTKLADIVTGLGRAEEAAVLLRQAADCNPTVQQSALLLRHLHQYVGATAVLAELQRVPPALRRAYDILIEETVALDALGDYEREIELLEELARLTPDDTTVWITLGEAHSALGRRDEAVAAYREAIRRKPTGGDAYAALSNLKAFRFSDADVSTMRKLLKKKLARDDAVGLNFALGKALEDRKLYAQSFQHYSTANALHAASLNRSDMFVTPFVNEKIATLTPEFFYRRAGSGCPDRSPIFVVGMHRSGSTLVEQILASHPSIEGAAEIKVMEKMWLRLRRSGAAKGRHAFQELASLEPATLTALGEEYIERAKAFRTTDLPYFVDKLPPNWMHLGLIRLALPNARIIDSRRHPIACGFSNFKQHYRRINSFAYSQESIGTFYRDYWRFMAHFNRVQPGAVHRVTNESLIENPEREIRRMLDFVGVPFDPACLAHQSNKRAVRTPSAEQVRRPINSDGVDLWKNYEPWLNPMKSALGPALEHWND